MKKFQVIAVTLLLCACGEKFTGLGSVDLHVTSITFHDSDPATITGTLQSGKPAEFIQALDGPFIQGITVLYSPAADTSGMAEANNTVSCFLFAEQAESSALNTVAEFSILHNGLSWIPDYAIRTDGGSRRVYATALMENTTAQTWYADTIRLIDPDNNPVTTATGHLTILPGSNPIPWWDAPAGVSEALILYGWPVRGRWNPMIAVECLTAGRVESWEESVILRSDTIWFAADSLLNLNLTFQQFPREYRCLMAAVSTTDSTIQWRIRWPERLPRGAEVDPGPDSFILSPGETVTIPYREIF
jgi:hypothetical protein